MVRIQLKSQLADLGARVLGNIYKEGQPDDILTLKTLEVVYARHPLPSHANRLCV